MMKEFIRKGIQTIRSFLDKAEASLDEPQQRQEITPTQVQVPDQVPIAEKKSKGDDLLVPFSKGNSSGAPSTYKDRKTLNALLDEWVHVSGVDEKQAKSMLRKHAEVHRIDYMTIGQVDEACAWLRGQIAKAKKQS